MFFRVADDWLLTLKLWMHFMNFWDFFDVFFCKVLLFLLTVISSFRCPSVCLIASVRLYFSVLLLLSFLLERTETVVKSCESEEDTTLSTIESEKNRKYGDYQSVTYTEESELITVSISFFKLKKVFKWNFKKMDYVNIRQ